MLHQFGKLYQWNHLAPPGLCNYLDFTTLARSWLDYSVVKVLQKSSYSIKDGTVYSIETYNFDWAPSLTLSNILTAYGLPDEVFISTFRNGLNVDTPYESWPYIIDLFYADQGIWVEYSRGPDAVGETLRNCFEDIDSPFINLWSPDEKMTSSEAINHFFDTQNLAYPISLEEATGMTVDTFYDKFKHPNKNNCLETPMALWPPY